MPGFNIGSGDRQEPSNIIESLRSNRWTIEKLGPVVPSRLIYAKSMTLPGFSVEEEVVAGAAIKYKFAKMVNWEDVTLSFYDISLVYADLELEDFESGGDNKLTVFTNLLDWQNLVYTNVGGIGVPNKYKDRSIFVLADGDGIGAGIPKFILHGSWPKAITHSPLSYESSDIKLVEMTLSYDFVTYE